MERSFLSNIITLDRSTMSMHTPKIKTPSHRGQKNTNHVSSRPRPQPARQTYGPCLFTYTRGWCTPNTCQRVLQGTQTPFSVPWGRLKALWQKRPDLVPEEWVSHTDNAPVHTAQESADIPGQKSIHLVPYLLYSSDLPLPTCSSSTHWRRNWQAWSCPWTSSRQNERGSSGRWLKMNLP